MKKVMYLMLLLGSVFSTVFAQGRSGKIVFSLREDTYNRSAVNGRRSLKAPAIAGAMSTEWIGEEKVGRASEFNRVFVADYASSFMFPGLRGNATERQRTVRQMRQVFRDSIDIVDEDYYFSLAQIPSAQPASRSYPDDPWASAEWHHAAIGLKWIASYVPSRSKVTAVIIDTGVNEDTKDLALNLNPSLSRTFEGDSSPLKDPEGHGTKVAGVIGAVGDNGIGVTGIIWRADIVSYKVCSVSKLEDGRTAPSCPYAAVLKAFISLQDMQAERIVVNISLIGYGGELLERAINALPDNINVVAAAGNSGNNFPNYPCSIPSNKITCVTATTRENTLAEWASSGSSWVHMGAPGVVIMTTGPNGTYPGESGTSFATPVVAGVFIFLWDTRPTLKAVEVRKLVLDGATENPSLKGAVAGGRQLSLSGSLAQLEKFESGVVPIAPVKLASISALVPVWTDQPGIAWCGVTSLYGRNFAEEGSEFVALTPTTRLGNVSVLVNEFPVPLTYVSPGQINLQVPCDPFRFSAASPNIAWVVNYDDLGNVLSSAAIGNITPVGHNPGFLTGESELITETRDGETIAFVVGLGFTNPMIPAGTIGNGTERVPISIRALLDGVWTKCSAFASGSIAGLYELHLPTPSQKSVTINIGDSWEKTFVLQ